MKIKNISFVMVLLCLSQIGITAEKTAVSVILSSGKKPYEECLSGFRGVVGRKSIYIAKKYNLADSNSSDIISEIKKDNPGIILALGTKAYKLTKEISIDIPVVYSMLADEKGTPRKNSVGSSMRIPLKMKVERVIKILPGIETLGTIYSSKEALENKRLGDACKSLGYNYKGEEITSIAGFPAALMKLSSVIDCFIMIPDPTVISAQSIKKLLTITAKKKIPVVGLSPHYTKAGALVSFVSDYRDLGRQAGKLAIKIAEGESAANLKNTEPKKIEVSLNLLAAKVLDIQIPQEEIDTAEIVIK